MYPKWKYHATKEPALVQSQEEEHALGKGWGESPAEFHEQEAHVAHAAHEGKKPAGKKHEGKAKEGTKA